MKPRRKIARYSFEQRPLEHRVRLAAVLAFAALAVVVALSDAVIGEEMIPQPVALASMVIAGICFVVCEDRLVRGGLVRRPRQRWRVLAAVMFAIALWSAGGMAILLFAIYLYIRSYSVFAGAMPLPALTIAIAAVLAVVLIGSACVAWIAEKRARQLRRRCASCGYSLRRNPSGVCPECGRAARVSRSSVGES